jgi:hypothetical protein
MIFLILWIPLSFLLGYYDVEHNILMAFCLTVVVGCISPDSKD